MGPDVTRVRVADPEDIDELCKLLGALFTQETEFSPDIERQRKGLSRIIENEAVGIVLVAERGDRIIGMVNLLYTVSTALGGRVAILEDMVVAPSGRGLGIGSSLMRAALERCEADGCERITLLTDHDNTGAHRFYQRAGFERSSMVVFRRRMR